MRRNFSSKHFRRGTENIHILTRKEKKEKMLKEELERKKSFLNFLYQVSIKNENQDSKLIFANGLSDFFQPTLEFETNKIHIFRGNNGQGKSTLLKDLFKSSGCGYMIESDSRFKLTSNKKEQAKALNPTLYMSPYNLEEDSLFGTKLDYTQLNIQNNISMYTDFTISYFQQKDGFNILYENMEQLSNGERKISGINTFFNLLKTLYEAEPLNIDNPVNLILFMDEPESGLSIELQEEFAKRINHYLSKFRKKFSGKINLTYFIVSHSFVWKDTKDILIHNINKFKVLNNTENTKLKKEYKKIFV